MNTTETTHNFINKLNEQQQLEHDIFDFVKNIQIKNNTLNKFRSSFINLYANYTFYVPNRNNYLKLFISIINYLQNAELGDNLKNIPWFNDDNYPTNFVEKYEFNFIDKSFCNESTRIITLKLTLKIVNNHLHTITLN
jgi:hypothetical protein